MHTIYQWLLVFFNWPNGSIWSNVLSNPIVIGLGLWWSTAKVKLHIDKHHEAHMKKLEEIHEHVKSTLPRT